MKLLAVILSVSAVAYGGGSGLSSEWKTYKHWAEMKAQESCWGEDNMKQYMVSMKKAVAKCNQVDAPELSLPPFKSTYRFINSMLTNAEDMENNKIMFLFKMMSNNNNHGYDSYNNNNKYEHIFNEMFNKHSNRDSYRPHNSNSNDWMEKMMKKVMMQKMFEKNGMDMSFDTYKMDKMSDFNEDDFMKSMMEYKMKQMDTPASSYRERMSELLSRNKRQANKDSVVSLDIGDRLADKVKAQQQQMQEKIGNMTCVLRECGILNDNNELDARIQKQYMSQYKVDKWLKERVEDDIDTCVEYATGIPSDYMESYNFPGYANVAQIKTYMKCIKYSKMRSCMYKDVKEKLEDNFGPLEKILEQTQLTEDQLYPLVMNLMHGDEMEFDF